MIRISYPKQIDMEKGQNIFEYGSYRIRGFAPGPLRVTDKRPKTELNERKNEP